MAAASSAGGNAIRAIRQDPAKYGSRLVAKCRAIWYEIFRLVDDGPIGNKNIATELPTMRPESSDPLHNGLRPAWGWRYLARSRMGSAGR
jgi:hypothetical protein